MDAPRIRIAIIGAGPAGCMLARILHMSNIPVTVFESDPSPNYRSQGGTLDLHPATGLAAIKDGKLEDEIRKVMRHDGDYYHMVDKHLNTWVKVGPSGGGTISRPEVDRSDLRQILAGSIPEGVIRWGHRLQKIDENGVLTFKRISDDQMTTTAGFDLVVGCEGAWSKVRNYLTATKPLYSGVCWTSLRIADAATTAPETHRLVNGGNVFCYSEGQMLALQQLSGGNIVVNFAQATRRQAASPDEGREGDENWAQICGYDVTNAAETKRALLDGPLCGWSPKLREAVARAEEGEPCDGRSLYRLPAGFRWEHQRGVTLIGDAAHLILPFTGEGVNAALDDARRLAASIIQATRADSKLDVQDDLDQRIRQFEKEMFARMEPHQKATEKVAELTFFSKDVKAAFPEIMTTNLTAAVPWFLVPVVRFLLHSIWFVRNIFWA